MAPSHLSKYLLPCAVLWALTHLAWCQTRPLHAPETQLSNNTCNAARISCSSCIRKSGCAWCIPNNLTDGKVATCISERSPCEDGTLVSPKATATGPGNNHSLNVDYDMALTTDISKLSLRVGEPQRVEMTISVSTDGLLDLYYLTDLSNSMTDDLKFLANSGEELILAMQDKTNNFRIGFGTFIDKKMYPYFDINYNNADLPTDKCQATYSFCNSMNLTENGKDEFLRTVASSSVGENKDAPEGGLDALMQVLVCEKAIGWRKHALKIVLYATESAFHYAGDGKLAGIDKLNDGLCHLDPENKYYTEGLTQDYPSVAQIARAAADNNIHVIFAVVKEVIELYELLTLYVSGSRATQLAADSSNIINIVTEEFEKISKTFKLTVDLSDEVKVSFVYECPTGSPFKCEGLVNGDSYKVTAEIELLRCPADGSTASSQLVMNAVGLTGNVTIDLDYICSCDCSEKINVEVESAKCSARGNYTCGQCLCPDGVYGTTCACDGSEEESSAACRKPGQALPCSGQGQCMCKTCVCDNDYYGPFCECVDKGCKLHAGKECNGHGDCKCGGCVCHAGWTGDSCSCSTDTTQCIRMVSDEHCSGHGECECNSCKCNWTGHGNDRYFGKYCQDCPTCGGECTEMKSCVLCYLLELKDKVESGVSEETCGANTYECANANITLVAEDSSLNMSSYSKCTIQVSDCTRYMFYRQEKDVIQVVLVGEWDCPLKWWEILLVVVVPMVVIGLLTLLIWYCIHQRNLKLQMLKFDHDTADAVQNLAHMNNLYKSPLSEMQNPIYGQNT